MKKVISKQRVSVAIKRGNLFSKTPTNLKSKFRILIVLAAVLPSTNLLAQKRKLSVEVDPTFFVFSGYAGNVSYKVNEKWTVGAAIVSAKFPNLLAKLVISDVQESTTLKLESGYTVFVHRFFTEKPSGWFVGLQAGVSNYKITDDRLPGQEKKFTTGIIMPRAGYKYYIKNSDFYLLPWAGISYGPTSNKTQKLGTLSYEVKSFLPFGALHLGYSF